MQSQKAKTVARLGMLFALAMALSFFESVITPLLGLMPAMKLGLANIVVMYAMLFMKRRQALLLVLLKAFFFVACARRDSRLSVPLRRAALLVGYGDPVVSAISCDRLHFFGLCCAGP